MLVLFGVLLLIRRRFAQAIPIPDSAADSWLDDTLTILDDTLDSDPRSRRTVYDIIWSCLATTIACTWVSVHPNTPFRGESNWSMIGRRVYLMFFSILAPEIMILWAFKQWRGALAIKAQMNEALFDMYGAGTGNNPATDDDMKEKLGTGRWTMAHGHFFQMGGLKIACTMEENFYVNDTQAREAPIIDKRYFDGSELDNHMLPEEILSEYESCEGLKGKSHSNNIGLSLKNTKLTGNILTGFLSFDSFKKLLSEGRVVLPRIDEEDINDKGKGDAFSKGIAYLQLVWFVAQIGARAKEGLAITELELTTAALACLNSVMYIFWWDKPLGVQRPLTIYTKDAQKIISERDVGSRLTFSESFLARKYCFDKLPNGFRNTLERKPRISAILEKCGLVLRKPSTLGDTAPNENDEEKHTCENTPTVESIASLPDVEISHACESSPSILEKHQEESDIPLPSLPAQPAAPTQSAQPTYSRLLLPFKAALHVIDLVLVIPTNQIFGAENLRFKEQVEDSQTGDVMSMIFRSESSCSKAFLCASSAAGMLFGAVHCIAWSFDFPSRVERIMWRAASFAVAGACLLACIGDLSSSKEQRQKQKEGPRTNNSHLQAKNNVLGLPNKVFEYLSSVNYVLVAFLYPIARITLIVIAITSMRSPPPTAFDTVQWIELIPHI